MNNISDQKIVAYKNVAGSGTFTVRRQYPYDLNRIRMIVQIGICILSANIRKYLGLPYVWVSPDTSSFGPLSGRVFGPIRKYIQTLPIAKTYDGMGQRQLVIFQYKMSVTSQNAILVQYDTIRYDTVDLRALKS